MEKKILITASILGGLAIILGAFGSHKLKELLLPEQLSSFEIGVRYQMYHALFLLLVANTSILTLREKTIIFYLAFIGVLLFSGSIYLLSTKSLTGITTKVLGPITPIGGMFLISSWGYFLYALIVKKS